MKSFSETVTSLQELPQQPYFWMALGGVAIIAAFFIYRRIKRQRIALAYSEAGNVAVTQKAIKSLITKTCQSTENISLQDIKVKSKKGKIFTNLKIKLNGNDSIEEACSSLQNKLFRVLQKNLGAENVGEINITTTGFGPEAFSQQEETNTEEDNSFTSMQDDSEPSYTYYEPMPDDLPDPFAEEDNNNNKHHY